MLIDVMSGKTIDRIPYRHEFDILGARLSDAAFEATVARIDELTDEGSVEIATAGWRPGSDGTGTPFEPIYTKAARVDSPVAPNDPWLGLHEPVNGHHESQRLTASEALSACSIDATWVDREDDAKEPIREAYRADLAALDTISFDTLGARLMDTQVLLTMKAGRVTWEAPAMAEARRHSDGGSHAEDHQ